MPIVILYLAVTKPYYIPFYNFMMITYFYLDQETIKYKER